MKRVLMRSRKDPFEIVGPGEAIERNVFGDNAGNLSFGQASRKTLQTAGTEVVANSFRANAADTDRINDLRAYDFAFGTRIHGDIADLHLITDVLITDYSSVFFDFAHSRKPVPFFTKEHPGQYEEFVRDFCHPCDSRATERVMDQMLNPTG